MKYSNMRDGNNAIGNGEVDSSILSGSTISSVLSPRFLDVTRAHQPPARYGAICGRACGRLCSTELHHHRGHDRALCAYVGSTSEPANTREWLFDLVD
jgi:hypothetical protein